MRSGKINGFVGEFNSSFLSCGKDTETILKALFIDSKPYSDYLKKLLIINTEDVLLDKTNSAYQEKIKSYNLKKLKDDGYIRLTPKLELLEHEDVKSYIIITFDSFQQNGNDFYRDNVIMIDILCDMDSWDIGNFQLRPLAIAGYIDGILNGSRLSGIGKLNFAGCNELILNEKLGGYCLMYTATHGNDDKLEENHA